MPNFNSLACLQVSRLIRPGEGGVCTVIILSNPTVVLCCVEVGVLAMKRIFGGIIQSF